MFPGLDTLNATQDLSNILVYANELTDGYLSPMILLAFFMIICIGSFFMQMRFTGRGRFELSFAAAGFSTFGFAVLMSTKTGLLNPSYLILSLVIAIIGAAILFLSQE